MIMFENPPPPSDVEYDDIEIPIFFSFPRPQNISAPPFIKVDYSLIHPILLGIQNGKKSNEINENEIGQEDSSNNVIHNVNKNVKEKEQTNTPENEETSLISTTIQNTTNDETQKNKENEDEISKEKEEEINNEIEINKENEDEINKENEEEINKENCDKLKYKSDLLQKEEHVGFNHRKRKQIYRKSKKSNRPEMSIDSDDENNDNVVDGLTESEVISKEFSKKHKSTIKNLDYSKPKSQKYFKSKHSKRISVSDDGHSSNSERYKISGYSRKHREIRDISSDDEYFSYKSKTTSNYRKRIRSPEVIVKQEIFSDEEDHARFRKFNRFKRDRFSESDDSIDNVSFYDRHHKRRRYDDDRSSGWYSPKKEIKQEIKQEFMDEDNKEFCGVDNYYCSFCKLTLNSELTWQSHLLGKRHARAIRAQSIHEVAKISLLTTNCVPIPEEGNRHDKPPPGTERVQLKNAISSIQEVCDKLREPVLGLKNVWEIRGETETNFYCNLCDAPCAASSVMLHLTGYKHKVQCLKEYFPQVYERFKDAHKKKIEKVIESKFSNHLKLFRKEKIRVFRDIPMDDYKKPFDQHGSSRQSSSQGKSETMTIKDEKGNPVVPSNQEFLDTKFADFHCTVCDSHMNNIAMWEAHIRGKRHLKNLKKDPEGVAATNKYVEAPPGTASNLEKQIREVCSHEDIVVGLNYIRENQGKNGNQYNCFPCGGCCSDIDIIDHILNIKHKMKILEKMQVDGYENSIVEINNIQLSNYYREVMVNDECEKMIRKYGRGKPQVYYLKRDLWDY